MHHLRRSSRRSPIVAALAAGTVAVSLSATAYVGAPAATAAPDGNGPAAASAHGQQRLKPPGPAGTTIVLDQQVQMAGMDMATDQASGVTYLGWISSSPNDPLLRTVHLCVLPIEAKACLGGVRSIPGIDGPSAAGIQVEITGSTVTLVWFHNTVTTGKLATATFDGTTLSAPTDVADAPANGQLFDVVPGPDGQLWAVTGSDSGNAAHVQVRQGLTGAPQDLTAPWAIGKASLAFAGSKPILLVAEYGSIGDPLNYASGVPWTGFHPINKTWTLGTYNDLVSVKGSVRMIGSENNADYRPVLAKWTGTGFSKPRLIGDNHSCPSFDHDLITDGSGRLADVSNRCGKLYVYNLPDTKNAALTIFSAGGTVAGSAPQISTVARGYGWVSWGILSNPAGTTVLVRPIRLPDLMKSKSDQEKGNKVTVKGPVSCLPVITVKAKMSANAAKGWNLVDKDLKLDGDKVDNPVKLDGEKLAAGSKHVLLGKGVFRKGNHAVTVTKKFKFTAC